MNLKKQHKIFLLVVVFIFLLAGCGSSDKDLGEYSSSEEQSVSQAEDHNGTNVDKSDELDDNTVDVEDKPRKLTEEEMQKIKPNELGEIMILMYHNIGEPENTWVRTPENFRKDLQVLNERGYRPISLTDYVNNNINVDAGYTPVVLTFDDGPRNNFNYIEKNGELVIDPDSAMGILIDFHEEHPDFPLEATFFIFYGNPFGQSEYIQKKLEYIVEMGMDIGNHTVQHRDLSTLSPEEIQKEIAGNVARTREYLPNYEVNTLALPYGGRPKGEDYSFVISGSYGEIEYHNEAVLLVGWRPNVSPIHQDFDPARIHRVRASEMNVDNVGMYDWLDYFERNPGRRYISDGNPNTITVPKHLAEEVNKEKLENKKLITYEIFEK